MNQPEIKKTSFVSDVLKLASGTTLAQIIGIVITPFLTRLYLPEAFGVFTIFISIIGILRVISCLRYEFAIILPESEEEAIHLLGVSLASTVAITLLLVPVFIFGGSTIVSALNVPELMPYLWLIPLAVLVSGLLLALNYWYSRQKQFGRLSTARLLTSIIMYGGQIGSGLLGYRGGGSLISAQVVAVGVPAIWLACVNLKARGHQIKRQGTWQGVLGSAARYRRFPLYDTWAALLNNISWQLPAFLLAAYFSPTIVGYYGLGNRLLRVPMGLIGGSIGQVFFQRAARAKFDGTLPRLVEDTFRRLVMLGMFPLLLLTFIGRDLFVVAFGQNWGEAGVYTQILSIWSFFWFVSSPLSTLFTILEKQTYNLILNMLIFITRLASLVIGGLLGNPRIALLLFAGSGILMYGTLVIWNCILSGVPLKKLFSILVYYGFLFVPTGIILITLKILFASSVWLILTISLLLSMIYYAFIVHQDPSLSRIIKINTVWINRGNP